MINEVKEIVTVLLYFEGAKDIGKDLKTKKVEDFMDIDYVKYFKQNHNRSSKTNTNLNKNKSGEDFCYLCNMKGHSTNKCGYNPKVRAERKRNNYKNKNYKKSDRKNYNERKYIGIIELSDNDSLDETENENICFDEIKPMFEKYVENIERISENEEVHKNENKEEINQDINSLENNDIHEDVSENKEIYWTFDTGCSEHITFNKNILKNFRKENIKMKCANNSICTFQGVGTFEGRINNEIIRLENVYYSENIIKI